MRLLYDIFVMKRLLSVCVTLWAVLGASHGVSTKVDFDEPLAANSSSAEDENVEVKHTIIVSTKLKSNNRRGLHSNDGDNGAIYSIGRRERPKEDSGEVPVIPGYRAVQTTQIRTPDTRNKPAQRPRGFQSPQYSESVFINRNIRDDQDIFPNIALTPSQWKPATLFNNINYWSQDANKDSGFVRRIDRPNYPDHSKQRKVTEDEVRMEFYCRKCKELSCQSYKEVLTPIYPQQRSWITTTPKMKIDGKLVKLN